jgi:GT2 family glycosyltransferase
MSNIKKDNDKNSLPLVSVILLSMNRKELLKNCLRSVQTQTHRNVEIIVVDNASSDGTGDMVRDLFPDIRYYYLSKNLGVPGGRNHGIRMACGAFCVFLDDDAIFTDNNALSRVVSYFRSDDNLGCIAFRIVQPGDTCEEYKSIPRSDKKFISGDYECSYFCGAGFAVRRSLFLKVGVFWEPLFFIGEELDLSYRLMNEGCKIIRSYAISVIHYETPQARVNGKWIYYGIRSRFLVPIKNLPWINVFSHILLWTVYFLICAIRNRHIIYFIKGLKDALLDLPQALRARSCITGETVGKLKKLSGRIYY